MAAPLRVWERGRQRLSPLNRLESADRLGADRACLAIIRKLLKRSYHVLRLLGEEALAPA